MVGQCTARGVKNTGFRPFSNNNGIQPADENIRPAKFNITEFLSNFLLYFYKIEL